MAEEKNIHLVRLNKLYQYLNDHEATIKIYHTNNGERNSTTYSANEDGNSIKDLFSHGCDVHGRALNNITGNRSFVAKKEIGRYKNVPENQKDVIKFIQYGFKDDSSEKSLLRHFSESKMDLFLKKNFFSYNFINIRKVYPSASVEIKNQILSLLKNGYRRYNITMEDGSIVESNCYCPTWEFGPLSDFNAFLDLYIVDDSVREDLTEIINYWENHFHTHPNLNDYDDKAWEILPGITQRNMPFSEDPARKSTEKNEYSKLSEEQIIDLLSVEQTWVSADRYRLMYALQQKYKGRELEEYPKYIHALILLMGAEFTSTRNWIYKTVKDEIFTNIEFSVRLSSEDGKADGVLLPGLSIEELSTILEDYNFYIHPKQAFKIDNNTITNVPLYRYGVQEGGFSYDKTEFQYALIMNMFNYLYPELKRHFGFYEFVEQLKIKEQMATFRNSILRNN